MEEVSHSDPPKKRKKKGLGTCVSRHDPEQTIPAAAAAPSVVCEAISFRYTSREGGGGGKVLGRVHGHGVPGSLLRAQVETFPD